MKKILLLKFFLFSSLILSAQCFETLNFGGAHTVGKKPDGTLWGWGAASYGNLLTTNLTEPLPIQLGTETNWNNISNGTNNTFAIKNNGTLWGCGSNQYGSLGVNSSNLNFTLFQQITTANNWVKVAPTFGFTIALKADGTIWAWGQNDNYQLGNSPASPEQLFPLQVGTDTDWVEIATGTNRISFAIKADGTIWGWGKNSSSIIVLGSGTATVAIPTQVGTDTDWLTMSVGSQHILAKKVDSTLWSWGGGAGLGVGGTPPVTNTPQQISTDKWISFSAGTNTSFGIKEDGTLWAWGFNTNGQLGDGTSTDRLAPTQIGTETNWATVEAGKYATTVATKTDGTVWYWGRNYYGEFGNGSSYGTAYYNTPTQTIGICVTQAVGGGPTYINSAISTVTSTNANGVGTAVGDSVRLIGVVHCQNYSSSGYDFVIIDSNNDGITLKSPTSINGYVPTEGDEIEVEGKITQINGLLQIIPDNILINQSNAPLQTPMIITVLDETTESQSIKLENLSLVNGETMWPSNGNIEVSNGTDNFTVNVPAVSALAGTPTPGTNFHLTGLGKQNDASNPYNDGYQIYPCGVTPVSTGPTYTNSTIGAISGVNPDGTGISIGDNVSVTGVVHCQNYSSSGYDLTMIDSNNDGINLFSLVNVNGYIPTEGDEIKVDGEIEQFNGMLRINPASITVLQQGAALQTPTNTGLLDEATESQSIKLENLSLVNGETIWPTNGNIEVTNGTDDFTVNVPSASAIAGTPTPTDFFNLTGIGKQNDSSLPYDSGYEIFPCGVEPLCNIDVSTTLDTGTVTVTDLGLNYQWIDCADSSVITGETGESFTATVAGDYAVIITDGNCVDTSACVFVDVLSLEENELKGISVYPNPISDELNINNEKGVLVSMEMIDAKGSVVVSSKEASNSFTFNTGELNSGVYILIVRSEKSVKTFKVVK
ncbi:T9SS type A sorting domain-containing protein [Brumimicrobium glaciale]|uniref:T9SS type A sorting domain-containing protein n=1 Tax=Brumimicrobium glaciale TaxID=200475 RepID=A0A4Q4KFK9_9FLAO|nr:T9SS type A sorting domain-containing protein [Brumimicrobium glaciale]RYM31307.1 T9SS type A sorting domain-containing protein [Brumimicrobium glaciale]